MREMLYLNKTVELKEILLNIKYLAASCNMWCYYYYSRAGMPVLPSQSGFCKVYTICPSVDDNRDKRGLALDGKLKHEDTNLASSTM